MKKILVLAAMSFCSAWAFASQENVRACGNDGVYYVFKVDGSRVIMGSTKDGVLEAAVLKSAPMPNEKLGFLKPVIGEEASQATVYKIVSHDENQPKTSEKEALVAVVKGTSGAQFLIDGNSGKLIASSDKCTWK
jgi:predicted RNA-binding Zn ribbon-like protein